MGVIAGFCFFAALLLHELGHAMQARREGVEIEGITLWLFGGVAQFRGMFPTAGAEFRIAIAGPLVSAALGGAFVGIAAAHGLGSAVAGTAAWLGYMNLLLLAFNMLPALPLDGGRVLRSALWRARGDFAFATRIAADVGRGFGYLLIALGLLMFGVSGWSGAWLAFLGWFLLNAAAAEGRYSLLRDALGDLRVRDAMVEQPMSVGASWSVADFVDAVSTHHYTTYPVVEHDRVVGLLPFSAVRRVPRDRWASTTVGTIAIPVERLPRVREDERLLDAVTELTGTIGRTLVWQDGNVVGLLSLSDAGRLVASMQPPRKQRPPR
jgi:Zn-dependent protease/predicted transcriptional regulator